MNISYIKIFEKNNYFFEPVKTCKVHLLQFDTTFKHYPDLLKKAEHRTAIKGILNELKKYLNRIEEGEST